MREQQLIDEWSRLLVAWTEAHDSAFRQQQLLDQKITNHFVYDKAAPSHAEQQQIDVLWQREAETRSRLDAFIGKHAA